MQAGICCTGTRLLLARCSHQRHAEYVIGPAMTTDERIANQEKEIGRLHMRAIDCCVCINTMSKEVFEGGEAHDQEKAVLKHQIEKLTVNAAVLVLLSSDCNDR